MKESAACLGCLPRSETPAAYSLSAAEEHCTTSAEADGIAAVVCCSCSGVEAEAVGWEESVAAGFAAALGCMVSACFAATEQAERAGAVAVAALLQAVVWEEAAFLVQKGVRWRSVWLARSGLSTSQLLLSASPGLQSAR